MHKIKRYANRKLYDVTDKNYITLDGISELIKAGEEISVVDNRTGQDLTSATVSQILARDEEVKSNDVASGVLVQLLRKGPGTLVDYGRKYLSAWERMLTTADGEIDKMVDRLVKEKEISQSEGRELRKDISSRADSLKKWIGDKIDQRINEAVASMDLATKEQVAGLTSKIESLTKKLEKLEKANARKAKKAAAPKKEGASTQKGKIRTRRR
jgi:polyhydroxyalkanoate synthesis repressor PhaR